MFLIARTHFIYIPSSTFLNKLYTTFKTQQKCKLKERKEILITTFRHDEMFLKIITKYNTN